MICRVPMIIQLQLSKSKWYIVKSHTSPRWDTWYWRVGIKTILSLFVKENQYSNSLSTHDDKKGRFYAKNQDYFSCLNFCIKLNGVFLFFYCTLLYIVKIKTVISRMRQAYAIDHKMTIAPNQAHIKSFFGSYINCVK